MLVRDDGTVPLRPPAADSAEVRVDQGRMAARVGMPPLTGWGTLLADGRRLARILERRTRCGGPAARCRTCGNGRSLSEPMDWFDPAIAVGGLVVGVVVGMTGMGGGALMTPMLVFFFGVPPLTAVSSDVVASFFMKPIGGLVHLRRGTVHLGLVGWLCLGSVPAAFVGVLLLRLIDDPDTLQTVLTTALGVLLVAAAVGLAGKAYFTLLSRERQRQGTEQPQPLGALQVRPAATVAVGALAGLIVGITSVGAGSILIVCLLALYPRLQTSQLVGTDLVQAVPLVASASVGHLLFGDFQLGLAASVLVGAIPGVWAGALVSSRTPGALIRRVLAVVMLTSGAKLLGGSVAVVAGVAVVAAVLIPVVWGVLRVRHGEAPTVWQQRRRDAEVHQRERDAGRTAQWPVDDSTTP